jgi:predicted ATP-dependent endonuclease of OLD family
MRIAFVEVQNFRKLRSIRIDFSETTTLFVGANNSGKTSAMLALGHFLVDPSRFTTNDFTLSNWAEIEKIATGWEEQAATANASKPTRSSLDPLLPALDLWLEVSKAEVHYVRQLLPTLDWTAGLLGVRMRFEPKDIEDLQKQYLAALKSAKETTAAAAAKGGTGKKYGLKLWPNDLRSFLDRHLDASFTVRLHLLDPTKRATPTNGIAKPQRLPNDSEPVEGNALDGLIRIDEIAAQRGLGESAAGGRDIEGKEGPPARHQHRLSGQLRAYYSKHLDPSKSPEPADLDALEAIESSQKLFDGRLADGFSAALKELATLNYPGVTDPKLTVATELRPADGLNHNAAVQYELIPENGKPATTSLRLPEDYNGLGYQNLILIVFKLMSFRDAWMRVGKAGKTLPGDTKLSGLIQLLHLVLVEEPEAHLHPQVQQVFVRQAYAVLRKHEDLGDKPTLQTQLIVSTHSSHVAHECPFSSLRYFRRLPPNANGRVPTSAVINLSEVFGPHDETEKFVIRYLRAVHCDLFFADAAILVEGPAERILVPHFIRKHFPELNHCYVTLMEVGGSHAHRLRPLIEKLGLTTLIITDLDSVEATGYHKATPPRRGCNVRTANNTLKEWLPKKDSLDELVELPETEKVLTSDVPLFAVRVAYQIPISVKLTEDGTHQEALATTFEDSVAFENLDIFREIEGGDLAKQFKAAIKSNQDATALGKALFDALETGRRGKAELALDLLLLKQDLIELRVPKYIKEGLDWLQKQLNCKPVTAAPALSTPTAIAAGVN